MGYSTSYQLDVRHIDDRAADVDAIIPDLRGTNFEASYAVDEYGNTNNSCKWYDHERDLKEFSKGYPSFVFTLHGEGEESGDLWDKYFVAGKMQECRAEVVYEAFDPAKLI